MRVAHIAFMYGSRRAYGACIAATRLHKALLARGVESHYLCWESNEPGENIHVLPRGFLRWIYYLLARCSHYAWEHTWYRKPVPMHVFPVFGFERELDRIKPDVVHVEWINDDFPSFTQLGRIQFPIVYSLHDLYLLNAVDPYPPKDDCRFVDGFSRFNSRWLERWLWNRKKKIFCGRPTVFVGPSRWICAECRASVIGANHEVVAIPNVMDEAYRRIVIAGDNRSDRFVIVFCASCGRKNRTKGFEDLSAALALLPQDIRLRMELRVVGESSEDCELHGIPLRFRGEILSVDELAREYVAADLCAVPSRLDNAPQVKFESLMCGTPVATFNRCGCPEFIRNGENGWVADDGDFSGFADGIAYFYHRWCNEDQRWRQEIARDARKSFATDRIVDEFLAVYRRAMEIDELKGS